MWCSVWICRGWKGGLWGRNGWFDWMFTEFWQNIFIREPLTLESLAYSLISIQLAACQPAYTRSRSWHSSVSLELDVRVSCQRSSVSDTHCRANLCYASWGDIVCHSKNNCKTFLQLYFLLLFFNNVVNMPTALRDKGTQTLLFNFKKIDWKTFIPTSFWLAVAFLLQLMGSIGRFTESFYFILLHLN